MKAIILCAGYGTRLNKYIGDIPKALIKIGKETIIDSLINKIEKVKEVEEIYVISNNLYFTKLSNWGKNAKTTKKIKILNDGTNCSEERLGAIADIMYVINKENINDDIIVMASDNYFDFELTEMVNLFNSVNGAVICTKQIQDKNLLKRLAVAKIDENGKVIKLIEKPENPDGDRGVFTTYIYKKDVIDLIKQYLESNNNPDAPGYFVEWLYKKYPVYSYNIDKECYDIGTYETLTEVKNRYD